MVLFFIIFPGFNNYDFISYFLVHFVVRFYISVSKCFIFDIYLNPSLKIINFYWSILL